MTLPADFITRIHTLLGASEAPSFLEALRGVPSVSIRLNRRKAWEAPASAPPVPWCAGGHYLSDRPSFTFDPGLHAGAYYVQEASSMFVAWVLRHLCDVPVRMLDLCAAPGGKSTLACDALPEGSLLVANEVVRSRAQVLLENLTKWGCPHVVVTNSDPADFTPLGPQFDIVLVDAPVRAKGCFARIREPSANGVWRMSNCVCVASGAS